MTFNEDDSRIRMDAVPESVAIIWHIALNLIKSDTSIKASVKRKLNITTLSDDLREALVRQVN